MVKRRSHCQPRRRKLITPTGFLGTCSSHGATCAICAKVQDFEAAFSGAHWARKYLRMTGWTYLPRWGWICQACALAHPRPQQRQDAAVQTATGGPATKGPRRVRIELTFL